MERGERPLPTCKFQLLENSCEIHFELERESNQMGEKVVFDFYGRNSTEILFQEMATQCNRIEWKKKRWSKKLLFQGERRRKSLNKKLSMSSH